MYIEKVSRSTRVATQIKKEMTTVLRGAKFASQYSTVNISRVDVSRDLKNAKIYYTSFADIVSDSEPAAINFDKDLSQIRYVLAQNLKMKYIPNISFHYDKELVAQRRVNEILDNLDIHPDEDA